LPGVKLEGDGKLLVNTSPWCTVVVDGKERGATPVLLPLPAGPHKLLLVNPEFHINREYTVVIEPGQTLRKRVEFTY
jgi:hypothetical protein